MTTYFDPRFSRPMPRMGRPGPSGPGPLDLTPNADLVLCAPYASINTAASNIQNGRDYLNDANKYRIRQNGSITRIRLRIGGVPTSIIFKVWRLNGGGTFDLVGQSQDFVGSVTANTTVTIDLTTSIAVQEGDFTGIKVSGGSQALTANTGQTSASLRYFTGTADNPADFRGAGASAANIAVPIECFMQAPAIVHIGDSRVAGHPTHYAFTEPTLATSIADTVANKLLALNAAATYQNMGVGSQTSSGVASRITADAVNLKPRACVIEIGVNDVSGSVPEATYIANMTTILNTLVAAEITPVVSLINPWKNGTSEQDATVNSFNSALITLLTEYPSARKVDCRLELSNGGDIGDVAAAYNADGVHFSPAGNAVIAQAIEDQAVNP